jgi:hypothetical protein
MAQLVGDKVGARDLQPLLLLGSSGATLACKGQNQ